MSEDHNASTNASEQRSVTLRERDPDAICAAFEELASLASLDLREWARNIARTHVKHYCTVFDCVERLVRDTGTARLLDVGAVPGFISVTLQRSGLLVDAVDINPTRARGIFEAGNVTCHHVDIEHEALPLEPESFDIVLFNEVIEHLRTNPIFAVREIHRVLRVGGRIVLSTPNITLPMRARFVLGRDYQDDIIREFEKLETIGHMGHFRLYSRDEIHRLLRYLGFEIEYSHAHSVARRVSWRRRLVEALLPEHIGDHLYVVAVKTGHRETPKGAAMRSDVVSCI